VLLWCSLQFDFSKMQKFLGWKRHVFKKKRMKGSVRYVRLFVFSYCFLVYESCIKC